MSERRYDIDWLRIFAVLLLFFYHPARIFYSWGGWYIENIQKSLAVSVVLLFIDHWHMPLLFFLAGASTYFALGRRKPSQYLLERLKRLLVPAVFGILIIVPPQVYLSVLFGGVSGRLPYLPFYPDFLSGRYTDGFDMGHLWFIAFLFAFSLAALPLFSALRRPGGANALNKVGKFFSIPGMIFLPAVFVMAANRAMLYFYPNPVYFFVYFVLGYAFTGMAGVGAALDRHKFPALVIALGLFAAWATLFSRGVLEFWWLQPIPRDLIGWSFIIAILGYGRKYLSSFRQEKASGKFLTYFAEASYPLYILHQTATVVAAYWIVKWDSSIIVKLPPIILGTFVISIVLYDVLIKRTAVTRFLMGMRPKRR